jgi:hypothetical protein
VYLTQQTKSAFEIHEELHLLFVYLVHVSEEIAEIMNDLNRYGDMQLVAGITNLLQTAKLKDFS